MRIALLLLLVACAHQAPVGELRFKPQAPIWRVDDRKPFEKEPTKREYVRTLYHADGFVFRRATRAMEVRPTYRAQDVNSLEEVPDSTWFTNRIGAHDLTIEEVRRANLKDTPFDHMPWTIVGVKQGGMSVGYRFEDSSGKKFILKFDEKENPEMETGSHAIVHRILWAIGYNVPEDHIGYVRASDLVIGEKAKKKGLDAEKLAKSLELVYHAPDGRIRVLASKFVDGKAIGPYPREGVRKDDPNDVIAHENRRSLRGAYSIFSWLNHHDLQEDNTLDVYTKEKYVAHYLIDFGGALGVSGHKMHSQRVGHTYRLDLGIALENLVTLGLRKRSWDGLRSPELRGIGLYDIEHYNPGEWRANSLYWPLEDRDRFDSFWGAKLLMRFTPEMLAAIVKEAQFSDPRSEKYMLDTLIARQRKTARYWFDRVAPLDSFSFERGALCFTDLTIAYRLRQSTTRYIVDGYDQKGKATGFQRTIGAMPNGRTCVNNVELAADDYTIIRLRVRRNAAELPPVVVHIAGGKVIGLRRR